MASPLISLFAFILAAISLGWQILIRREQIKHNLYDKRFACVQSILPCLGLEILHKVVPTEPPFSSVSSRQPQDLDAVCQNRGYLTAQEAKVAFEGLQHIYYLYDKGTGVIAKELCYAVQDYRSTLNTVAYALIADPKAQIKSLNEDSGRVKALAAKLIPKLEAPMILYREPWWVRVNDRIDAWDDTVTDQSTIHGERRSHPNLKKG